jgi:hypothetical protein
VVTLIGYSHRRPIAPFVVEGVHMSRITLMVTALLAASPGGSSFAGEGRTTTAPTKVKSFWNMVTRIAGRLKGRVLASRIEKGMTENDVEAIVGKDELCEHDSILVGGIIHSSQHYFTLGLHVSYDNVDPCTGVGTDTLRVTKVTFPD